MACRGRFATLGARASRPQSRACARRTLTLALSHKGRRDPLVAIRTWFRMADLVRLPPRPPRFLYRGNHGAGSANDGRIPAARYSPVSAQCRRPPNRAGGSRPPPAYPPKGHHQRRLPPPDAAASRVCSRVGTWIGWRLNSPICPSARWNCSSCSGLRA